MSDMRGNILITMITSTKNDKRKTIIFVKGF